LYKRNFQERKWNGFIQRLGLGITPIKFIGIRITKLDYPFLKFGLAKGVFLFKKFFSLAKKKKFYYIIRYFQTLTLLGRILRKRQRFPFKIYGLPFWIRAWWLKKAPLAGQFFLPRGHFKNSFRGKKGSRGPNSIFRELPKEGIWPTQLFNKRVFGNPGIPGFRFGAGIFLSGTKGPNLVVYFPRVFNWKAF